MKRVPPSERTKEAIRTLLSEGSKEDPRIDLVHLAVRRIVEEALEAEMRDKLGRDYYQRKSTGQRGYRNGYREGSLATAEGEIRFAVPQVRDLEGGSESRVRAQLGGRTAELERLATEMYARGLSTRDIEDAFRNDEGTSLLSRSAVSEVTEALWKEYEAFAQRDLSEFDIAYLFVDGVAERLHEAAQREAVLVAWAITGEGRRVLLHLAPGTKESTSCVRAFFEDMKRRGLRDPIAATTDGAPGLIRAVEECFTVSLRQRCLAHRMRNIMDKLPSDARSEFKDAASAAYNAPNAAMAAVLRNEVVATYGQKYPSAVACFEDDFDACIAHLSCPPKHRRVVRTTNLLERLFVEERRRMRAARPISGEHAVLKLMFGALIRHMGTRKRNMGIDMTEFERRQLAALREQLEGRHKQRNSPIIKPQHPNAAPSRVSSSAKT
jgi:transposase-like protein